jgi:hypothetical protein
MRVAFFLLQAASADDESQKKGVQLILQIFDPPNSRMLKNQSIREQFRRLFACSPVRFSTLHVCLAGGSGKGRVTEDSKRSAVKLPPSQYRDDAVTESVAIMLGIDERVRTKFHSGKCRSMIVWLCRHSFSFTLWSHRFHHRMSSSTVGVWH